jgi:hypothetical protein
LQAAGRTLKRRTAHTPCAWQVAGHGGQIMRNLPNESRTYWHDGAYAPRDPGGTMADRQGWCMGNHDKRQSCLRDLRMDGPDGGRETRFSFQFLTKARATAPSFLPNAASPLRMLARRAPHASKLQPPRPLACRLLPSRLPRPAPSPCTLALHPRHAPSPCTLALHPRPRSPTQRGSSAYRAGRWATGRLTLHSCRHACTRPLPHSRPPSLRPAADLLPTCRRALHGLWRHGLQLRRARSTSKVTLALSSSLTLHPSTRTLHPAQCPQYEYFKPDAYDYSLSKEERAKPSNKRMGPSHLAGIGRACREFIEAAVVNRGRRTQVYHLGMTPLPGWTRDIGGERVEADIFASIHAALGLRCHEAADGTYTHSVHHSSPIVTSIDRYAVVGQRKRDGIHPFWNAQFAIVQLMLNHMCPR